MSATFWIKRVLRQPAAVVALLYVLTDVVLWSMEEGFVPIAGVLFAGACTGCLNALLLAALSVAQQCQSWLMKSALLLCSLALFALVPVSLEIKEVLHNSHDAQTPIVIPFYGGAMSVLHGVLSLLLIIPLMFREGRRVRS